MGEFFIGLTNKAVIGVAAAINSLVSVLPNSPFTGLETSIVAEYLGYINWLVPVGQFIVILTSWTGCIALWYVIQIAMRWAKAIE